MRFGGARPSARQLGRAAARLGNDGRAACDWDRMREFFSVTWKRGREERGQG
jgi:hypothetical protein